MLCLKIKIIPTLCILVMSMTGSLAYGTSNLLPDYSDLQDEQLHRTIKSGVIEIGIGFSPVEASAYVPNLSLNSRQAGEIFNPKTVCGMGRFMVIDGAKKVFFGSKEAYQRYRLDLNDLKKGVFDIDLALS
jgi:hypothetical protein